MLLCGLFPRVGRYIHNGSGCELFFVVVVGGGGGVWCPVQFGPLHLQSNLFQLYAGTLAFSSAITALLARYA